MVHVCVCMYVCVDIYISHYVQILFPYRLLKNTEYSLSATSLVFIVLL